MSHIEITDADVLQGEPWAGRNWSADAAGSIHNDAVASKLGFRGGTVAGSIHMDQFAPVLLDAYGERWFRDGALSLHFANATTDGERVQVTAERPAGGTGQIKIWMDREDGMRVAAGTASVGDHTKSELRTRDLRPCAPEELRMLRDVYPGQSLGRHEGPLAGARQRERLAQGLISTPLDWYDGDSPFGGAVASPSTLVELLWGRPVATLRELAPEAGKAVGLFGAIEVAHVAGPVFLDRSYIVTGEIVALAQSPKTESLWFDSRAEDADGNVVATHRMMLRFMKSSSPLYAS